jgi:hypothetical protein
MIILCALVLALDAPLCPTATFLGVPCPGCGLTRATLALLHGDLRAAVRLHPLSPLIAPLFFALVATAAKTYLEGPPATPPAHRMPTRWLNLAAWFLFLLVFGVWVARFFGAFGGPVPVRSLPGAPLRGFSPQLTR